MGQRSRPFQLAKNETQLPAVGGILYDCTAVLRIASVLLWPVLPDRVEAFWERWAADYAQTLADRGRGQLRHWTTWGGLEPGARLAKSPALFPRAG